MNTRAKKNCLFVDTCTSTTRKKTHTTKIVEVKKLIQKKTQHSISGEASCSYLRNKAKNSRSCEKKSSKNRVFKVFDKRKSCDKNAARGAITKLRKRPYRKKMKLYEDFSRPAKKFGNGKTNTISKTETEKIVEKFEHGRHIENAKTLEETVIKQELKIPESCSENVKQNKFVETFDAIKSKNEFSESCINNNHGETKLEYHEEDQNNGIDEVIISVEDFCETKQDRSEVSSHHECAYCDRKFLYRKNLRAHMKMKHTDIFFTLFSRNIDKSNYSPCEYCERKFKYRKNMKAHVREKHPEKIVKPCNDDLHYECSLCFRKFKHKKNLIAHIRQKHKNHNESSIVGMMTLFGSVCKFCGLKFMFKKSLNAHIRKDHIPNQSKTANEDETVREPFICSECGRVFLYKRNLNAHIRIKHSEDTKVSSNSLYKCTKCDEAFQRVSYLKNHLKVIHCMKTSSSLSSQAPKTCPLCGYRTSHRISLLNHFTDEHRIEIQVDYLEFENIDLFNKWKDELENETKCRYNKISYKLYTDRNTTIFQCHRSGHYKARGSGYRLLKAQGSKKLNAYCPAQLHVSDSGNCIRVRFTSTHVGHENELCHMYLKQRDREIIAQKLALGMSPEDIVAEADDPENSDRRESYIDLKDVYNVQASFKLKLPERCNELKLLSLDDWLYVHQNDVLLYEKEGSLKLSEMGLESDDFMLILMSDLQKEMFCKFGGHIVCVQTIRNPSKYSFVLTTVMVLDEYCESFPVAFLFSNRINDNICQIFFHHIASSVGPIQPNVFMSDRSTELYKAWVETMLPAHRQLFCTWHVLRDWKNNAVRITNEEKRKAVLKMLENEVLKQVDYQSFEEALNKFLECSDEDMQAFLEYFIKNYLETIPSWAYCFRLDAQINTNLSIETFYRVFRYVNTKDSLKLMSIEEALYSLTKHMEYKKRCRKVTSMKRFKNSKKISTIRKNHKNALNANVDEKSITVTEDGWLIPSFNDVSDGLCEMFLVRKNETSSCVDCKLVCPSCNICIHNYSCSCLDYSIRFTMCEHIHYLCNALKTQVEIEEVEGSLLDYNEVDYSDISDVVHLTAVPATECESPSVDWNIESNVIRY